MNGAPFRAGLREVAARGLVFELQVFASQMADAARLAGDFPDVTFVLLHAGMLEDRSAPFWKEWREGMRALAAHQNVCTKLSGLGTFVRACSVELWKPVVEETLDIFGARRCVFGSNFPIEKLWTSYGELIAVMKEYLDALPATERQAVFYDNALRVYAWKPRSGSRSSRSPESPGRGASAPRRTTLLVRRRRDSRW
jgi:predicted TIM-barrel fold metal-dependent hydrolase